MHSPPEAGPLAVRILERKANAEGVADSGEPSKVILSIPVFSNIHNGGHLAFGPDGMLHIGMGDTGPQGDPRGHGQDLNKHLGKILRIDVDHVDGDKLYSIPPDNPFRDRKDALPEIWAYGLREPWRFSFDPPTGDLWVGDVGQGLYEEVTIVRRGENHGWNVLEGFRPYSDRYAKSGENYVRPVFAYHHRVGPSVTGGFVYRGKQQPALVGKYICGDYETRRVWALTQRDRTLTSIVEIGRAPERIVSFGLDDAGEIYIVGFDHGIIYHIDASSADLEPVDYEYRDIVAISRQSPAAWHYTTHQPTSDWFVAGFDDSRWNTGLGGFGSRGTPGAAIGTEWGTPDIWLRREFSLAEADLARARLLVHHDEDAEIYINGVLATRLTGFTSDYELVELEQSARDALHAGKNALAVHCHQTQGGQYIDVGVVEAKRRKAQPPE
jgi:hypothetical protein